MDIMAQQLKFISCLKILMEELSTLATGFEADGGQLRYVACRLFRTTQPAYYRLQGNRDFCLLEVYQKSIRKGVKCPFRYERLHVHTFSEPTGQMSNPRAMMSL